MFGTIAEPRAIRLNPYSAAFERKLLPNFSEWMLEQIKAWDPDFLIPIETRGVHVLDAALTYAREHLGREIETPILYRSALAYLPRDVLERSRLLIIEDAIDTGGSLERFLGEIHLYGASKTRAIACFGSANKRTTPEVECYLLADRTRYVQYLWQLTEIVVARGLPPEVDHAVYELNMPIRLTRAWHELQSLLPRYGQLTVDGPESKRDELQPMTLHFPRLDGTTPSAFSSSPHKVRFFPDPAGDRILVLPIAFPALRLPPMAVTDQLPLGEAEKIMTDALGAESEIGRTLLERAHLLDPLTIFRATSTAREVAMVTGVARAVGEAFSGTAVSAYDDVFGRLFGQEVGNELSVMVERQLDAAASASAPAFKTVEAEPELIYLDDTVAEATRTLAGYLKDRSAGLGKNGNEPASREAVSLAELIDALATDGARSPADPLLASRCSTYGLAISTLVPFIAVTPGDEVLMVERKYHVSEPYDPKRDLEIVRREKSAQAVAVICRRIQSRVEYFSGGTPLPVLAGFIALLRPLVLEPLGLELKVTPGADKPLIVLCDMATEHLIREKSQYFEIDKCDRVRPSKKFSRLYKTRSLDLDIGQSTLTIEREVDTLIALLGHELGPEEFERLMRLWTMSADHALGLTHIRSSLLGALDEIRDTLNVIAREDAHDQDLEIVKRVSVYTENAREKLERLQSDQGSIPHAWDIDDAGRREEQLAELLGVSSEASPMYGLAGALTELVEGIARITSFLDAASSAHWGGHRSDDLTTYGYTGGEVGIARASLAASTWGTRARETLMTLTPRGLPPPSANGSDEGVALAEAATAMLELTEQIVIFAAALAGVFCCLPRRDSSPEAPSQRETTVLVMDIAGYRAHRRTPGIDIVKHRSWTMRGVELVAQWARAYGGLERPEVKGDEIVMEFDGSADSAVLAAASMLCHTSALRSMAIDAFAWEFHNGIDHGYIDIRENNVMGECIDNPSAFSKQGATAVNDVKLTEKAQQQCSTDLRALPSVREVGQLPVGKDSDGKEFHVRVSAIDGVEAVVALTERLRRMAGEIRGAFAEAVPSVVPVIDPLPFERPESSEGQAEEPGSST